MFVGLFRLTSDHEFAALRIDLDPSDRSASYQILDCTGGTNEWRWDLSEGECNTFQELAHYALMSYLLNIIREKNWTGTCEVVVPAMGLNSLSHLISHVMLVAGSGVPADRVLQ